VRTKDTAVEAVRDLILSGQYGPGARLGEADLAELVGVSRTPVREALRHLAAEGLVEIRPNKGARVVEWSADELDQVFDLRAQVEGLAARRAATRATAVQLDQLEQVAVEHLAQTQRRRRDLDRVYALNSEFHGGVVALVGGASLPTVIGTLVHTAVLVRTLHTFDDAAMLRSAHHHLELVAALRARDPEWAESVMRSHLLSARASLLGPRQSDPGAG
jgi:DNA-binding GntR family transcriptional regulator